MILPIDPGSLSTFFGEANPKHGTVNMMQGVMADIIEQALGEGGKLVLFLTPPAGGATTLLGAVAPFYLTVAEDPAAKVSITGFSPTTTAHYAYLARQALVIAGFEEWGNRIYPYTIGSSAAGKGFGLSLIDKPFHTPADMGLLMHRQRLIGWIGSSVLTRLGKGGCVIMAVEYHELLDDFTTTFLDELQLAFPTPWQIYRMTVEGQAYKLEKKPQTEEEARNG